MSMMTLYGYEPTENIIDSCLHGKIRRHEWLKLEAKRLRKSERIVRIKKEADMSKLIVNRLFENGSDKING